MKLFLILLSIVCSARAANQIHDTSFYKSTTASSGKNWWRNGSKLDLDFVNNRYFFQGTAYDNFAAFVAASAATYSRASSAYSVSSNGLLMNNAADVARFDYDPLTGESKGLLIEETSTNQLRYSQDFSNGYWEKTSSVSVTSNAGEAPDGSTTAALMTASGTSNSYFAAVTSTSLASQTVTRSIYAKAGSTANLIAEVHDSGACSSYCRATFNLGAKTAVWNSNQPAQGPIKLEELKNGWFRLSYTFTHSASSVNRYLWYIGTYGFGLGNIYVWGAQLEIKPFASTYIPTTATTETRAGDVFSIPPGSWFTPSAGTFIGQSYSQLNGQQNGYSRLIGGSSNKAFISYAAVGTSFMGAFNGSSSFNVLGSGWTYPSPRKSVSMVHAWNGLDSSSYASGSTNVSNVTLASGDWSTLAIYPGGSNYDPINAPVQRVTFFPIKMPDEFLKSVVR